MNAPCRCLSVVGVAALALGAASAAAHAEEITITFASYGGALQRAEEAAWLQPFQALHPEIKIAYDIVDPVKLKAMVEAGRVVWQVASVGPDFGLGSDENLLEKIDCGIVPCDQLQPSLYPTTGYRAAYATSGLAIGYNTTLLPAGKVP